MSPFKRGKERKGYKRKGDNIATTSFSGDMLVLGGCNEMRSFSGKLPTQISETRVILKIHPFSTGCHDSIGRRVAIRHHQIEKLAQCKGQNMSEKMRWHINHPISFKNKDSITPVILGSERCPGSQAYRIEKGTDIVVCIYHTNSSKCRYCT